MEARDEIARRNATAGGWEGISAHRVYDLILLATGDREKAETAFREFRHAELQAGKKPS